MLLSFYLLFAFLITFSLAFSPRTQHVTVVSNGSLFLFGGTHSVSILHKPLAKSASNFNHGCLGNGNVFRRFLSVSIRFKALGPIATPWRSVQQFTHIHNQTISLDKPEARRGATATPVCFKYSYPFLLIEFQIRNNIWLLFGGDNGQSM